MRHFILFLTAIGLLQAGCHALPDMDPPEVVRIVPCNESSGHPLRPEIFVEFSEEMDRPQTESAFHLSAGGKQPRGYFRWEENRLHYDLIEDLSNGESYTITIADAAEDARGNNLREEARSSFSVGTDFQHPLLLSSDPADGGHLMEARSHITLRFSEPMKLETVRSGITLSPPLPGSRELLDGGRTFVFTPYSDYTPGTLYRILINREVSDLAGNGLLEEYTFLLTSGNDFQAPSLDPDSVSPGDPRTGIFAENGPVSLRLHPESLTEGVDKDSRIVLVFSEPMDRLSLNDSVSLDPPLPFTRQWENDGRTLTLLFDPAEPPRLARTYTLVIRDSARDRAGHLLDRSYACPFRINGSRSLPPAVVAVHQMPWLPDGSGPDNSGPDAPRRLHQDSAMDIASEPYHHQHSIGGLPVPVYILRIEMDNTQGALPDYGLSLLTLFGNTVFSLETSYGPCMEDPQNPVLWKMEIPGDNPHCVDLYLFQIESGSYYRLFLKGGPDGVKDTLGNYLLDDFLIFFNS